MDGEDPSKITSRTERPLCPPGRPGRDMDFSDRHAFLRSLIYLFVRRYVMMAVTFVVVMILFCFGAYLLTPTWEAEILLLAEQPPQPPPSPFGGGVASPTTVSPSDNLATMLGGKGIAYDMVKEFHLDERTRLKAQKPSTFRDWAKVSIMNVILSPITLMQKLGLMPVGEIDWVDKAAEDFREGLTAWEEIEAVTDTQVVSLIINGETPELATQIANAMVRRARERLAEATARARQESLDASHQEVAKAQQKLDEAEAKLKAFQEQLGGVTLDSEAQLKTSKLQDLTASESKLRAEIDVLGQRLKGASTRPELIASVNSESVSQSQVVQTLRSSVHASEARLAVLLTERTADHPDVINLKEEIASLFTGLRTEIENVRRKLVSDQVRTQAEIAELEKALLKLPAQQLVLAELMTSVTTYRRLHQQLLESAEEGDVLARTGISALDFKVLDDAYVSPLQDQDFPKWLIVLVVGAVASAGAAFGLPLLIEYWRDPIKGPADLAPHSIAVLGVVPLVPIRSWRSR